MKALLLERRPATSLLGIMMVAAGLVSGCGGGERMESGTQVEVTQDMVDEAAASDAYFDSQGQGSAPAK